MIITMHWLAVVLATLAGMATSGVWYGKAFGAMWREMTGVTPGKSKKAGNTPLLILFAANALTAVILAAAIAVSASLYDNHSVWLAALVGFLAWLAFSATTLVTQNTFEQKPQKLTMLNVGYQLALFTVMSIVIGLFS